MTDTHEHLTDVELCKRLRISGQTSWRWRVNGGGPPYVRAGKRRVLYRLADVEAWEREHIHAHRAAESAA
jgi:predicted DNA-binding transcriptional regulator AlpA